MEEQGRSLCIVPMQPQHIDQLERLEKECFSAPWSYDALVSELSNPLAVFRVAQQPDGSVAGYVGCPDYDQNLWRVVLARKVRSVLFV